MLLAAISKLSRGEYTCAWSDKMDVRNSDKKSNVRIRIGRIL
jgi:hypothetical protein